MPGGHLYIVLLGSIEVYVHLSAQSVVACTDVLAKVRSDLAEAHIILVQLAQEIVQQVTVSYLCQYVGVLLAHMVQVAWKGSELIMNGDQLEWFVGQHTFNDA